LPLCQKDLTTEPKKQSYLYKEWIRLQQNISHSALQQLRQATQTMQNIYVQVESALNAPARQQLQQLEGIHQTVRTCYEEADRALSFLQENAKQIQMEALRARL
jgi:hypothetical protein